MPRCDVIASYVCVVSGQPCPVFGDLPACCSRGHLARTTPGISVSLTGMIHLCSPVNTDPLVVAPLTSKGDLPRAILLPQTGLLEGHFAFFSRVGYFFFFFFFYLPHFRRRIRTSSN